MTEFPREYVQSYLSPPTLELVGQRIVLRLGGAVIAETVSAYRVMETHHTPTYRLPPEDVRAIPCLAPGASFCEWEGYALNYDTREMLVFDIRRKIPACHDCRFLLLEAERRPLRR